MAIKTQVVNTLKEAHQVQTVWETIPDFSMGEIALKDFIAIQTGADELSKSYSAKDNELTGIRVNRDDKFKQLRDLVTRFRSGMRAAYGSDSEQYERAGGTRSSSRKRPVRTKTETTSPAEAPQA